MRRTGLGGTELEHRLRARNIFAAMVSGDNVMLMTGIGNRRCDYERLISALTEISEECLHDRSPADKGGLKPLPAFPLFKLKQHPIPKGKENVPLKDAAGRICAAALIPYPPGIPLICPGEEFDEDTVQVLQKMLGAGQDVMGVDDDVFVLVGK